MLQNAGVQKKYRELDMYGPYVYRDDMARIMVDAFSDKFTEYAYLYGNNIEMYTFLLKKLDTMSTEKQERYVEKLIKRLEKLDHETM